MAVYRELTKLEAAINEESWQWATDNVPVLAEALRQEVAKGASPEDVRRFVMKRTQRPALAMRLQQAAAYLARQGEG